MSTRQQVPSSTFQSTASVDLTEPRSPQSRQLAQLNYEDSPHFVKENPVGTLIPENPEIYSSEGLTTVKIFNREKGCVTEEEKQRVEKDLQNK
ncbi:hypothetical protein FDP41_000923 [Naegleria fowleri]|uniref:Uncharacterized protein n=1 Tax=Naegleria fowleri TaxID=5763 RepID=A0A6A5C1P6_NAEFO|nr:uncharacterized protein FDP41_000923 [Naegleria fowleri]KAF0979770.1 hypothetical protein FDP41_000923 [Naegleria fowleri]CAG4713934.1 unnamed protein product [Naegleria fowleri]